MSLSMPALHPPVMIDPTEMPSTLRELTNIAAKRAEAERAFEPAAPQDTVRVSLTTVSASTSFDAYIYVRLRGADRETRLILDSGNDSLVVPFAQLSSLSDFSTNYRILSDNVQDPFGLSAKLLQGPVDVMTAAGSILTLKDCIFYGCTDTSNPTANFGIGCISPWRSLNGFSIRSPLTYLDGYPVAEIRMAEDLLSITKQAKVQHGVSSLILHKTVPAGFQMINILKNCAWMAVVPYSLKIGNTTTFWPEPFNPGENQPIAMIDTGGTWPYMSDPSFLIQDYLDGWSLVVPQWTTARERPSIGCVAYNTDITIELGDEAGNRYSYRLDPTLVPDSKEMMLVRCDRCGYMMEQKGMNIGGLSLLFNTLLIDYSSGKVGFKSKLPTDRSVT